MIESFDLLCDHGGLRIVQMQRYDLESKFLVLVFHFENVCGGSLSKPRVFSNFQILVFDDLI